MPFSNSSLKKVLFKLPLLFFAITIVPQQNSALFSRSVVIACYWSIWQTKQQKANFQFLLVIIIIIPFEVYRLQYVITRCQWNPFDLSLRNSKENISKSILLNKRKGTDFFLILSCYGWDITSRMFNCKPSLFLFYCKWNLHFYCIHSF